MRAVGNGPWRCPRRAAAACVGTRWPPGPLGTARARPEPLLALLALLLALLLQSVVLLLLLLLVVVVVVVVVVLRKDLYE